MFMMTHEVSEHKSAISTLIAVEQTVVGKKPVVTIINVVRDIF